LLPASFTTGPKSEICNLMQAPNSSPEPSAGSAAFANATRTLGLANTLLLAASSGGGVPAFAPDYPADKIQDD